MPAGRCLAVHNLGLRTAFEGLTADPVASSLNQSGFDDKAMGTADTKTKEALAKAIDLAKRTQLYTFDRIGFLGNSARAKLESTDHFLENLDTQFAIGHAAKSLNRLIEKGTSIWKLPSQQTNWASTCASDGPDALSCTLKSIDMQAVKISDYLTVNDYFKESDKPFALTKLLKDLDAITQRAADSVDQEVRAVKQSVKTLASAARAAYAQRPLVKISVPNATAATDVWIAEDGPALEDAQSQSILLPDGTPRIQIQTSSGCVCDNHFKCGLQGKDYTWCKILDADQSGKTPACKLQASDYVEEDPGKISHVLTQSEHGAASAAPAKEEPSSDLSAEDGDYDDQDQVATALVQIDSLDNGNLSPAEMGLTTSPAAGSKWDYCVPLEAYKAEDTVWTGASKTAHYNCRCAERPDILERYASDPNFADARGFDLSKLDLVPFQDRITVESEMARAQASTGSKLPLCMATRSSGGFRVCPVSRDCATANISGAGGGTAGTWYGDMEAKSWDFCTPHPDVPPKLPPAVQVVRDVKVVRDGDEDDQDVQEAAMPAQLLAMPLQQLQLRGESQARRRRSYREFFPSRSPESNLEPLCA